MNFEGFITYSGGVLTLSTCPAASSMIETTKDHTGMKSTPETQVDAPDAISWKLTVRPCRR